MLSHIVPCPRSFPLHWGKSQACVGAPFAHLRCFLCGDAVIKFISLKHGMKYDATPFRVPSLLPIERCISSEPSCKALEKGHDRLEGIWNTLGISKSQQIADRCKRGQKAELTASTSIAAWMAAPAQLSAIWELANMRGTLSKRESTCTAQ